MNPQLALFFLRLTQAQTPEDIFGDINQTGRDPKAALQKSYHQWAKLTHPDMYTDGEDKSTAERSFTLLTEWFGEAQEKLRSGRYGQSLHSGQESDVILSVRDRQYFLNGTLTGEEIYNLYPCHYEENGHKEQAVIKVVRRSQDNKLAQNEARILTRLSKGRDAVLYRSYIPYLLDSFLYRAGSTDHAANVYPRHTGWYSFKEIHQAYPDGIQAEDMAWMWRRLLVVLGFAHRNDVVHTSVLPGNVRIQPQEHGLMLDNWLYAITYPHMSAETAVIHQPQYLAWYPNELRKKESPTPAADLYMAAKCMIYLLGGDPKTNRLPVYVHSAVCAFLRGCLLPKKTARPEDAWELLEEFDELISRLWGERKFHPFHMK